MPFDFCRKSVGFVARPRHPRLGGHAGSVAARRLPPEQVNVVRAAAVIGNTVPNWLLVSACGGAPDQATVRALADADFLYAAPAAGGLRFKHGITKDAVYESIGLRERQALHQRVEIALLARSEQTDREDTLEALAYHSRGAGHWENAAALCRTRRRQGDGRVRDGSRCAQYQVAMETLDRVQNCSREQSLRWCQLANKLGMASIFDPLVAQRRRHRVRTRGGAGALAGRCQRTGARAILARLHVLRLRTVSRGRDACATAMAAAREAGENRLAAQIEASLGQILAATCQYDEAIALMDRALSAKQQRGRPSGGIAIGSAYALSCKGSVLADRGDFAGAHACFGEAMILLDGSTHPVANSVRNWMSVSLIWQGRWQEAERLAVESARVAENMHGLLLLAACRAAAGFARWAAPVTSAACNSCAMRCSGWRGGAFGFIVRSNMDGWSRPAPPKEISRPRDGTPPRCCVAPARASGWARR